jgi:hypothetical protein
MWQKELYTKVHIIGDRWNNLEFDRIHTQHPIIQYYVLFYINFTRILRTQTNLYISKNLHSLNPQL